ncbi:MAG TPA: undecaprenyldiphospho-muramoylpentapeptide beta-N-acetylglucosaminyltransferase [Candidatus Limnocylindria bacterium]|nr:undecaprenyldiphospho-muramoylpentapeptide beta-N-acetylglucosaminyltransferase [Candidatus Limnocylindria bacterium]
MSGPGRVVIAGGGTGGHVFPALALAEALAGRGADVHMIGTVTGLEARVVPGAGYPFHVVPGAPVRGGGVRRALGGLNAALHGVRAARRLLRRLEPSVVVGVGGYASVATVLAARSMGLPALLQEQNAIPGLANRVLGRVSDRICLGFATAERYFPAGRAVHTGNPIRAAVLRGSGPGTDLLVFGGSQGARRLNQAMVAALPDLVAHLRGAGIVHQTGALDLDEVRRAYERLGVVADVRAFIDDMGSAYGRAAVVVARAGAMSCAEITARGLPAILVPYPHAADDHQRANAAALAEAGAAEMILDGALDGPALRHAVAALFDHPERRARMAAASRALGRPDAAARVADEVTALAAGVGS